MNKGVKDILSHIERAYSLSNKDSDLEPLKNKINKVLHRLKHTKYTGDALRYVEKFKSTDHKDSDQFLVFRKHNILRLEDMYDYLVENYSDELDNKSELSDLKLGRKYSNYDLMNYFLCSEQGGMRRSKRTNTLIVISDNTKPLYKDFWENGKLHYTGMGQTGDMDLFSSQNKTVYESNVNGVDMHLFEVFNNKILNKYEYKGLVILAGKPYQKQQLDKFENLRKVWMFPLKPVNQSLVRIEDVMISEEQSDKAVKKITTDKLIRSLKTKTENRNIQYSISKVTMRDSAVKEYTKRRANGYCELCKEPAPFLKSNGEPYLEVHHLVTISENGPDHITNTVALCPNCHRKLHYAKTQSDKELLIEVILNSLIGEDELLKKAINLFDMRDNRNK